MLLGSPRMPRRKDAGNTWPEVARGDAQRQEDMPIKAVQGRGREKAWFSDRIFILYLIYKLKNMVLSGIRAH